MQARYAACHVRIVAGSDHALSDFDEHLPAVLAFLGLADAAGERYRPQVTSV